MILLVEPNIRDAQVTLRSFKASRLISGVRLAGDGPEALDFLLSRNASEKSGECQPELIVLNLTLPILSGLEVLRIIKNDPRTRRIPVVVLTSSASDLDIQKALKLRADALMGKPVTVHKLLLVAESIGVSLSQQERRFSAGDRLAR